jgi:hypothetical protein
MIKVTHDPTSMALDCSDYYEDDASKKYVSKLLARGVRKENVFYSTEQQCLKTDLDQWLPETIKIVFSADGTTATLTSTYQNHSGSVNGSGVLQRTH